MKLDREVFVHKFPESETGNNSTHIRKQWEIKFILVLAVAVWYDFFKIWGANWIRLISIVLCNQHRQGHGG